MVMNRERDIQAYVWISLAILFRSLASVLAKKAALLGMGFPALLLSPWYAGALFSLFLQSIWWILTLRHIPLNVAYPFLSLVFVINLITAVVIFGEVVYPNQILGILFIVGGVLLIGNSQGGLGRRKAASG